MKKIVMAAVSAMVLVSGASAAKCSVSQSAYSVGFAKGDQADGSDSIERTVVLNGSCVGVAEAYNAAKIMNPSANKISADKFFNLCRDGANAAMDNKKPNAKYYKESCENYIADVGDKYSEEDIFSCFNSGGFSKRRHGRA